MWIKINNTSWNISAVLKHEREAFIELPQHRAIIRGSEEKKTKDLSGVYSICLVHSKIFNENGGANVETGGEPEHSNNSEEGGTENIIEPGASEPGRTKRRPNSGRKADKAVLPSVDNEAKATEGAGNEVGNA